MTKLDMYCVYDEKANAFLRPFCMPNSATAVRALRDSAKEEDHPFCKNPEDYTLYQVGTFDEERGEIEAFSPIRLISSISQCITGGTDQKEKNVA